MHQLWISCQGVCVPLSAPCQSFSLIRSKAVKKDSDCLKPRREEIEDEHNLKSRRSVVLKSGRFCDAAINGVVPRSMVPLQPGIDLKTPASPHYFEPVVPAINAKATDSSEEVIPWGCVVVILPCAARVVAQQANTENVCVAAHESKDHSSRLLVPLGDRWYTKTIHISFHGKTGITAHSDVVGSSKSLGNLVASSTLGSELSLASGVKVSVSASNGSDKLH
ncbi:hypothetical protein P691DRAFT_783145 [Macrolepiota fuliginosa MF-IS2]|uniref:Uncharacterized protein n=1 Tax=Macrolepiota fuliginosa MF-IS2 TaxID=1400762 RepID=A0A9P5X9B9_9AGAR|nr:hypothetical protein P691DRAFT_783145 [Macrolepiota fuliginosa MF-IS2]